MIKTFSFLFTALFTLFILWGIGFTWFAVSVATMTPKNDARADAIIVLTGGDKRIMTGIDLLLDGRGQNLFISGVNKQTRMADLIALKPALAEKADCCVTLGYEATNTNQNAAETAAWMNTQTMESVLLVTSAYHMHRSKLEFHRAAPGVRIVSYPVVTKDETWHTRKFWVLTLEEYNKIILVALNLGRDA